MLLTAAACPTAAPSAGPTRPAGAIVAPDAVAELVFASLADVIDAGERASRLGFVPAVGAALSARELEVAGLGGPVALSVRRSTHDVLLAARVVDAERLRIALPRLLKSQGLRLERRVGTVDAVIDGEGTCRALVRIDAADLLLAPAPEDCLASAALWESVGTGLVPSPRRGSTSTELFVHDVPGARTASATVAVVGDDVIVAGNVVVDDSLADVVRGLNSTPPDFACAIEEQAILAARLPPLAGAIVGDSNLGVGTLGHDAADAFDGRIVVAVYAPPAGTPVLSDDRATLGSLLVGGRPRSGGRPALEAALGVGTDTVRRAVAGRMLVERGPADRPWRKVTAVVDDDVFALGIGVVDAIERVAATSTCPSSPNRLLVVDGRRLRAAFARVEPGLALLGLAASLSGAEAFSLPWAGLLAVDRWEVDARFEGDAPEGVTARVTVRLRLPPHRAPVLAP
jgi:hypothetical protein